VTPACPALERAPAGIGLHAAAPAAEAAGPVELHHDVADLAGAVETWRDSPSKHLEDVDHDRFIKQFEPLDPTLVRCGRPLLSEPHAGSQTDPS
jgi:predicted component of type VI protein secretion system